jgi:hypothetical protein
MRDAELYRHLLGLAEPRNVERVELNVSEQRVHVWASHTEGQRFACPEYGVALAIYDLGGIKPISRQCGSHARLLPRNGRYR